MGFISHFPVPISLVGEWSSTLLSDAQLLPPWMALPLSGSGAHTSVRKVTTFHWPELDWVAPGNCWGAWEKKPGWVISKKRTRVTSTGTPGSLSYPFSLSSCITPTLCPTLPAPGPRGFLSLLPQPRQHCSTGHEAWAPLTSSSPPANYLCLPTERTLALVECPLYLRTMAAHPTPVPLETCGAWHLQWLVKRGQMLQLRSMES